jgi:hemerythrin-like metal-binding protein
VFGWNPAYSVNIGSIDAQHRSLLTIGRKLCNAVSTGQSRALTYNIVDRLVQYTATHFAHEERLMRAHAYPDIAAHQAEHEAMAAKAVGFRAEFKAGRAALSMEILRELESLITGHIQGSDRRFSTFLHETAAA